MLKLYKFNYWYLIRKFLLSHNLLRKRRKVNTFWLLKFVLQLSRQGMEHVLFTNTLFLCIINNGKKNIHYLIFSKNLAICRHSERWTLSDRTPYNFSNLSTLTSDPFWRHTLLDRTRNRLFKSPPTTVYNHLRNLFTCAEYSYTFILLRKRQNHPESHRPECSIRTSTLLLQVYHVYVR